MSLPVKKTKTGDSFRFNPSFFRGYTHDFFNPKLRDTRFGVYHYLMLIVTPGI